MGTATAAAIAAILLADTTDGWSFVAPFAAATISFARGYDRRVGRAGLRAIVVLVVAVALELPVLLVVLWAGCTFGDCI